jgi:hypothetical protein
MEGEAMGDESGGAVEAASAGSVSSPEGPERGAATFRESFRRRVDSNPVAVVFAFVVAAIGTTTGVVIPAMQLIQGNELSAERNRHQAEVGTLRGEITDQKTRYEGQLADLRQQLTNEQSAHQTDKQMLERQLADEQAAHRADVAELQRSLASIKLSLGSGVGEEYLDVAKTVVNREDRGSVPTSSLPFDGGRFYAVDAAGHQGWTYDLATEAAVVSALVGAGQEVYLNELAQGLIRQGVPPETAREFAGRLRNMPVHRWRLGPDRVVESTEATYHFGTQVWVERVAHEDYLSLLLLTAGDEDAKQQLKKRYQLDPSGTVLQTQIISQALRGLIDTLQKRGDFAYATTDRPFDNVRVDGVLQQTYHWRQDWLIASTPAEVYLVVRITADDGRATDAGELSQWLEGFRICRNC